MNKHSHTDAAQPYEGTASAQPVERTSPQATASVVLPNTAPYGVADAPAAPLAGVLGTVLALAFVLALAWILLKVLQRTGIARNRSGKAVLQVVQQISLGGRERVALVRHGDREYLLGVTPHQVHLLAASAPESGEKSMTVP
ncbi:MAG TPA: flagellar biosynthetic protein FliO [Acidovorax sp.]|nr:flagellar biosynthetic protein FliO [Acidovorax sp.]